MKFIILAACASCCLFVLGDDNEKLVKTVNGKVMTQSQIREISRQANMRRYGGYVRKDNSAKGVFVVLNSQTKISTTEISNALETITFRVKVQTKVVNVNNITMANVFDEIAKAGGVAGVALIDGDLSTPALLSATEEGWSIVNIARLIDGNPTPQALNKRVRCELLRGFSFAVGGVYGARGDALMQPIRKPQDLDSIVREDFAITMMQTFSLTTPRYGLVPWVEKTYLKACEEGWAPQPTNEYQKAIWDKVNQPPANPMMIEYDPKRGR